MCVQVKSFASSRDLTLTPIVATRPFAAVAMDLYSPGDCLEGGWKYVLTLVDLCTRWVQFIPLRSKLASEVMVNLCLHWICIHGVPGFLLSDRGKEFLGVVSSVCKLLDIKQICTTPYHPQTNGLCEVQHKSLSRELRIRSQRAGAPAWVDLLCEIQFAFNIAHADEAPHLSPFELVYGRKPRLSARDICVAQQDKVIAASSSELQRLHEANLVTLQGMRLTTAENQIVSKLNARDKRDKTRNPTLQPKVTRGMLVHVQKPTRVLKKLTFQWTPPSFLVLKEHVNTCTLLPLVSPAGRGGQRPKAISVNRSKMKSADKPPCGFWIGSRILRTFNGKVFSGIIDQVEEDDGKRFFHVSYDDFDEEELDFGELIDSVYYHPELDAANAVLSADTLPKEGTFVLFAADYEPRVGKVIELRPDDRKQIVIQMWRPKRPRRGRAELSTAQYATRDSDSDPDRRSITLAQVRVTGLVLTEENVWDSSSRVLVRKALRYWTRGHSS